MRVVLINGSPRVHGNSHAALKHLEGKLVLDHDVALINICKHHIKGCTACNGCRRNHGCVLDDETNSLMEAIRRADVLVFATPVYWWGMSGQLKTFIDKFYSDLSLSDMTDKRVGLISVGAASLDNRQYQLISDQFECIFDFLNWHIIFDTHFSGQEPGDILTPRLEMKSKLWLEKIKRQ